MYACPFVQGKLLFWITSKASAKDSVEKKDEQRGSANTDRSERAGGQSEEGEREKTVIRRRRKRRGHKHEKARVI